MQGLAELVKTGRVTVDTALIEHYQSFVARHQADSTMLKRLAESENLVDLEFVFARPEAWHEKGLPQAAIAPMMADYIWYRSWGSGDFYTDGGPHKRDPVLFHARKPGRHFEVHGKAPVPLVPKTLAPTGAKARRETFVLFETPLTTWKEIPIPADPYLLTRVTRTQFRIVGKWDVSPKEAELLRLLQNSRLT